jgi:hypothetical protein
MIILGQNSSDISQMIGEIWAPFIENGSERLNGRFGTKSDLVFEGMKILWWKVDYRANNDFDYRKLAH